MKALVLVKRCVDHAVAIRLKTDGTGVETAGVKMAINPFDEIAMEEAVRLKDQGVLTDITAIAIGPAQAQDTLRHALAMGATHAIHIAADTYPEPLDVAKTLAALATREHADLILCGKQAIDDDYGHEGVMTGALLNWNTATNAARIDVQNTLKVTCETDTGEAHVDLNFPAVITCDLRLNTPRSVPLPKVLEARKKTIESVSFSDLNVAPKNCLNTTSVSLPEPRAAVIMLHDMDALETSIREALA